MDQAGHEKKDKERGGLKCNARGRDVDERGTGKGRIVAWRGRDQRVGKKGVLSKIIHTVGL